MRRNPPCYRCESSVPLEEGRVGLCQRCELEVRASAQADPASDACLKCGHVFFNDWERLQHEAQKRHNYRAWTDEDRRRAAEKRNAA